MAKPETPRGPGNPRVRAGFYGMAALYLAYLYYQLAEPFFKGDPTGPPLLAFGLGTVVLGGGTLISLPDAQLLSPDVTTNSDSTVFTVGKGGLYQISYHVNTTAPSMVALSRLSS